MYGTRENFTVLAGVPERDIDDVIERCSACQQMRNAQAHEPLITTPVPKYPFQKVGADLFVLDGVNYLLTVDYYSKWITIVRLRETKFSFTAGSIHYH